MINSYRDLKVWQEGMDLAEECYRLTRRFPQEEMYGITSQIRRAAVSVPANIAEGYGRDSRGEFVQFLRVAQGSLKEVETHLLLAQRIGYLSPDETGPMLIRADRMGRMLRSLYRVVQSKPATKKP
jgi:four helix bundle protein